MCALILETRSLDKYWRKIPLLTDTVLCSVLPFINSGDDIVVIYKTERIYIYYQNGKKVETIMTQAQLNPKRRFIPYTNSLAVIHELKK